MDDDILKRVKDYLHQMDPNPIATGALTRIVKKSMANREGDPRRLAMDSLVIATDAMASMMAPISACTAGCDHCCKTMAVSAHEVEAEAIASYLRSLPQTEQRLIIKSLREQADVEARIEKMPYRQACAFLENGRCSIYEIRPIACRRWVSSEVQDCTDGDLSNLNHAQNVSMVMTLQSTIAYFDATDDVVVGYLANLVLGALK